MDGGDLGLMAPFQSPPSSPIKRTYSPPPARPTIRSRGMRRSSSASHTLQHLPRAPPPLKRVIPFPTEPLDQTTFDALSRWITCFAVCEFDLDAGPDLDGIYPPVPLTALEHANIAFASMPDTAASQAIGTSFSHFCWRMPRDLVSAERAGQYLHGYVCFMQQKKPSVARGFVQRSLVLITPHSHLTGLFTTLITQLGSPFMRNETEGSALVEVACRNIARWPKPTPGSLIELPLLGKILLADVPLDGQAQAHDARSSNAPRIPRTAILASCPLTPLSLLFKDSLPRLWLAWELLVTSEPILVYAPGDPATASELVTWLVTLVRPLSYGGDWRPLFTLQQSDYAALLRSSSASSGSSGSILGVTSPLVFSACRHFPHVFRASAPISDAPTAVFKGGHAKSDSTQSFREAQDATGQGFFSSAKRVVHRDSEILKSAQACMRVGDYLAADAILVRHFTDLTERLLVPLNRYFATIQPQSSPGVARVDRPPTFDRTTFMASLRQYDTPLRLRRSAGFPRSPGSVGSSSTVALNLYDRVLRGVNFASWLRHRTQASVKAEEDRRRLVKRFEGSLNLSPTHAIRPDPLSPTSPAAHGRSRSADPPRKRLSDVASSPPRTPGGGGGREGEDSEGEVTPRLNRQASGELIGVEMRPVLSSGSESSSALSHS